MTTEPPDDWDRYGGADSQPGRPDPFEPPRKPGWRVRGVAPSYGVHYVLDGFFEGARDLRTPWWGVDDVGPSPHAPEDAGSDDSVFTAVADALWLQLGMRGHTSPDLAGRPDPDDLRARTEALLASHPPVRYGAGITIGRALEAVRRTGVRSHSNEILQPPAWSEVFLTAQTSLSLWLAHLNQRPIVARMWVDRDFLQLGQDPALPEGAVPVLATRMQPLSGANGAVFARAVILAGYQIEVDEGPNARPRVNFLVRSGLGARWGRDGYAFMTAEVADQRLLEGFALVLPGELELVAGSFM